MNNPSPTRWRMDKSGGRRNILLEDRPKGKYVGYVAVPALCQRVCNEHNTLIDVLDLADRGAPAFQIAEFIRDSLGIAAPEGT